MAVVGDVYRFLAVEPHRRVAATRCGKPWCFRAEEPPPHTHSRRGRVILRSRGRNHVLCGRRASWLALAPRQTCRRGFGIVFKNETDVPSENLISVAPARLEEMFLEVGQPTQPGASAVPPTREEIERLLLAVAPRYGLEIRLPG